MRHLLHPPALAAALATLVFLAGCGKGFGDAGSTPRAAAPSARSVPAEWINNRLEIDVPTQVVTIGFSDADVAALAGELTVHTVDHTVSDFNQPVALDLEEPEEQGPSALIPLGGETIPHPVLPTAVYSVQAAPEAMVEEFKAVLASVKLDGNLYDANAMEDWLAEALPRHGFSVDGATPGFVVLHLAAFGVGEHAWKIQGDTGFLQPVRLFGERTPLLVLDPSAIPDPYAGTTEPYMNPVASSDAGTIATFVREATEYRVLQASIYPVAQAPCHAVTAVVGVRPTSLAENGVLLREFADAFEPANIKRAFDNLTGTDVFLDVKILSLPVDDPVLDVLGRGEFPAYEVLRGYLTLMFDQYHVDHPGCEEYLSVLFAGDVASAPSPVIGIGTYDDNPGKRISMSWLNELIRLVFDPETPLCQRGCEGKDYLNWWEDLLTHETGHILGQRHPHDIDSRSSSSGSSDAFSSIWSNMSYQQDGRMVDFGKIDHNNWLRNRAGFALYLAAQDGREGTPAWTAAMDAARALDWQGVWEHLRTP
jgi:hypothetical protein